MLKFLRTSAAVLALLGIATANWQFIAVAEATVMQPYRYNSDQSQSLDGTKQSQIYGTWVNYFGDGFKKIDLTPVKDATGFHISKAPYSVNAPLKANGNIEFIATNKWDAAKDIMIPDAPISAVKHFTNAQPVDGIQTAEGILYPSALPDVNGSILLQPYEEGFKYLVRWDVRPCTTGTIEIPFTIILPVLPTDNDIPIGTSEKSVEEIVSKTSNVRGIRFKEAEIWDKKNDKREKVEIVGRVIDNAFIGKKIIDCRFFTGAQFPVYTDTDSTFFPDPDVETATFDGNVAFSNADWATAWGNSVALDIIRDDSTVELARVTTAKRIDRVIFGFNTGVTVPDTDTVSATTITIRVNTLSDLDDDGTGYIAATAMSAAPASATAITDTDYALITATARTENKDLDAISTGADNVWTFNATGLTGVSKTGITWMMFRDGHDIENNNPNDTSGITSMAMAETTGTTDDPLLTVTHAAAAGGGETGNPDSVLIVFFLDFRTYA